MVTVLTTEILNIRQEGIRREEVISKNFIHRKEARSITESFFVTVSSYDKEFIIFFCCCFYMLIGLSQVMKPLEHQMQSMCQLIQC